MKTTSQSIVHTHSTNQQGSALVTVMLVVLVTSLVAGSFYLYAASTAHQVRRLTDAMHAQAIAEAGANQALSRLKQHYGLRHYPIFFPSRSFGGGRYDIILETHADGRTRIISIGSYQSATNVVGVNVRDANRDQVTWRHALGYAIFSDGDLRFNGSPEILGDAHANGFWTLNGNYNDVNGMISAQNSETIPLAHRADWVNIPFPQLSDPEFQAFLDQAEAGGIPITRIQGNQVFQQNYAFDGIYIIEGNVIFRGAGTRDVNGMLYVTGNITANGAAQVIVDGLILSGGDIRFNGAAGVYSYNSVGDGSGGGDQDASADVVVSAWWQGSTSSLEEGGDSGSGGGGGIN